MIELPALQAMAGALDLLDLRLRSYDAAVQSGNRCSQIAPNAIAPLGALPTLAGPIGARVFPACHARPGTRLSTS